MASLHVRRTPHRILPDPRRVIAKSYLPGEELITGQGTRSGLLMDRILAIPEDRVLPVLASVLAEFSHRHANFEAMLESHFERVAHHVRPDMGSLSRERRLLIGAYYTHEYSIEGAALFNPSIVLAPDQVDVTGGARRVILSLRAVGEGHVSSIEFRTAVVHGDSTIAFDPVGRRVVPGKRSPLRRYDKRQFSLKLGELGVDNAVARSVIERLPARFTLSELDDSLAQLDDETTSQAIYYETTRIIRLLAASNYTATFHADTLLSERVLFPASPHETHGMEDARFVRFQDDDGAITYFATYTAYDGVRIFPQLIETTNFRSFDVSTLQGSVAQNKGMALFPRKIGGKFVMLSRKDRENLYLATSDDVHNWNESSEIARPASPWQLVQIGNCGSPIETEAGWLVITHGVGPMRRYAIGALLLDLEDPRRVLGRLADPLFEPNADEREGYVPNVVYSCGGIRNGDDLVLPYGLSDGAVGGALVSIPDLVEHLRSGPGDPPSYEP